MKAPDFEYEMPATLDEALALLSGEGREAQLIAGGQSLMPMMNFRLAQPDLLVDLNGIDELKGIAEDGEAISIGAMSRYSDLDRSAAVETHLPLVKMALPHIAHAAIRNRGTIGGSIALADPAAEMPAVMLALDMTVVTVSAAGERRIPADEFFLGLYTTALDEGEIIKAISVRKARSGARFAFKELARRHGDYAIVGVAIAADGADPISKARIVFFGVNDRPIRATGAEDALNGRAGGDDKALAEALDAVGSLEFNGDLNASADMKKHLAQVILKRAMAEL